MATLAGDGRNFLSAKNGEGCTGILRSTWLTEYSSTECKHLAFTAFSAAFSQHFSVRKFVITMGCAWFSSHHSLIRIFVVCSFACSMTTAWKFAYVVRVQTLLHLLLPGYLSAIFRLSRGYLVLCVHTSLSLHLSTLGDQYLTAHDFDAGLALDLSQLLPLPVVLAGLLIFHVLAVARMCISLDITHISQDGSCASKLCSR